MLIHYEYMSVCQVGEDGEGRREKRGLRNRRGREVGEDGDGDGIEQYTVRPLLCRVKTVYSGETS